MLKGIIMKYLKRSLFGSVLIIAVFLMSGCIRSEYLVMLNEVQKQLEIWKSHNINSYKFSFTKTCLDCSEYDLLSVDVTVTNGQITELIENPLSNPITPSNIDNIMTIDQIFRFMVKALQQNVFNIHYTFDLEYGHPTSINIDYTESSVTDQIHIGANGLIPM